MANETALKDGNRVSTLLFEQAGETRRVSPTNPLPVTTIGSGPGSPLEKTKVLAATGNVSQILATPAAGKKIVVKGCTIANLKGVTTIQFQGGQIDWQVSKPEHSGGFIPMNLTGNIDQPLLAVVTGAGGGDVNVFHVNYQEE